MPNCGCEHGEPCNYHAAEDEHADEIARDEAAVLEEIEEEPTQPIANVSMTQMALEWIARQRSAAAAVALALISFAVIGCGGAAPAQGIAGAWSTSTAAGSYDLLLRDDGTASYSGVKATGKPIGWTGTWSIDADQLTITAATWSSTSTYRLDGDRLVLTDGTGAASSWRRAGAESAP